VNADVTIIIVTWNSRDDLPGCLGSIGAAARSVRCEVIVVDNQSTDGTVAFVESSHPEVRLLVNRENRGFAAANNQALRIARSRYLLLLNPDTVLQDSAIDRLVHCLDTHPAASAVGPTVLNSDGSLQRTGVTFPSTWNILVEGLLLDHLFPRSALFGGHRRLFDDPRRLRTVDYVQGSCLMVRSAALERAGVLDEDFFMYFEETDWCYRLTQAGGRVLLCPDAAVVHFGGEQTSHYGDRRLVYYHRGLLLFYRKHCSTRDAVLLRLVLLLRSLVRTFAWALTALMFPGKRQAAVSSLRGYLRTFGLLFTERLR
jgi:GT2 family glycosyltransferase